MQALRFEQLAPGDKLRLPIVEFFLDRLDGALERILRHDVMRLGIDGQPLMGFEDFAEQRVNRRNGFDLIAPELNANRSLLIDRIDLDDVAARAKGAARKLDVVARILNLDELLEQRRARQLLAFFNEYDQAIIRVGVAETVDARHRGDDDAIAPLEQTARRRQSQAVDLFVDRRFLLDEGVGRRDVGFGLIVIVITDEVFDGVLRKERLELLV